MQGFFGICAIIALGWLCGERRGAVHWKRIAAGLALQFALAVLMLHVPQMSLFFEGLNHAAQALSEATNAGSAFVFGYLNGQNLPFDIKTGASTFIMAFASLPMLIVISALSALLFYWRILPIIVCGLSWVLKKSMGISGALAVGVCANIFMGMVESPLLVRQYLGNMSRGALFGLMVTGMSTVAGTVLVLYGTFLAPVLDNALGHVLTASLISCPAALLMGELFIPMEENTGEDIAVSVPYHGSLEAICAGTSDGLRIFWDVVAMLLVFVALVHLANMMLGVLPDVAGAPLSFQRIAGWLFMPVAWLIGIPWAECAAAGSLLGTKLILNEMIAYLDMVALPAGTLSPRSMLIMAYALCGFANLGSLGIMIASMSAMLPERAQEIRELGPRAVLAGALATCMTGAVVGILL